MKALKSLVRAGLRSTGLKLSRIKHREVEIFQSLTDLRWGNTNVAQSTADFLRFCGRHVDRSYSQLFQDLLALYLFKEKRGGFFIEFGAADGIKLSNSYLLERDYSWNGIVAEPAQIWHDALKANRHCSIDLRCVWNKSGQSLIFNETKSPELATINAFSGCDNHNRSNGTQYEVEAVSLNDLLEQHGAPATIDYLSIDTEGSELEILKTLSCEKWNISLITVEHNYSANRSLLEHLLVHRGYSRIFPNISACDDWYVHHTFSP